jgi:PAS domain-containing protein
MDAAALLRIERVIGELERLPDANAREKAREAVRAVLDLHRAGLARLIELTQREQGGQAWVDRLGSDPLLGSLLALHDLHPHDLRERVEQALAKLAPELAEAGVSARFARIDGERVEVVLTRGARTGRGDQGLLQTLEAAIGEAAPEVVAVVLEVEEAAIVPVEALVRRGREARA